MMQDLQAPSLLAPLFVVTLPASAAGAPADYARRAQRAGAGALEIRGDLTPDVRPFDAVLPLLVAPRGRAKLLELGPRYVDLELGEDFAVPEGTQRIRSFHDHERTPPLDELARVAAGLRQAGADVIKIATTVRRYADLETLASLRQSLSSPYVVLGMGERAHLDRLLSPRHNAFTYASLDRGDASAPGQIALDQYHPALGPTPALYGILGGPGLRSRSPRLHNDRFERAAIDAVYAQFPTDDLDETWPALQRLGVRGFSVTTPHKQAILRWVDRLDAEARRLGSTNTIVREGDAWVGYQTDALGFVLGYPFLRGASTAAIAGTGGVVPAVIEACRALGIGDIRVHGRDARRLAELVEGFSVRGASLASLAAEAVDAVVWTIPIDVEVELPRAAGGACAIDLRYDVASGFLARAAAVGYRTHDGVAMLEAQAARQFELFARALE